MVTLVLFSANDGCFSLVISANSGSEKQIRANPSVRTKVVLHRIDSVSGAFEKLCKKKKNGPHCGFKNQTKPIQVCAGFKGGCFFVFCQCRCFN